MKNLKIDELLQEKETLFNEASAIVTKANEEGRKLTADEVSQYDAKIKERNSVIESIRVFSDVESRAQENVKFSQPTTKTGNVEKTRQEKFNEQFKSLLNQQIAQFSIEQYADPLLSTTNTTAQTRTVEPGVSILQNDGLAIAKQLGIRTPVYAPDAGEKVLVSHVALTGSSPNETVDVSSANMSPLTLSIKPHRIGLTQTFTYEELALLPSDVYNELLLPMETGCDNKALTELFANFVVDASGRAFTIGGTKTGNKDFTDLQAEVPYFSLKSPQFATTPAMASYLKNKVIGTVDSSSVTVTVGGMVWDNNNKIAGTPAIALSNLSSPNVAYFDANELVIAQWGNKRTIVDTVSDAKGGKVRITTFGMYDTGVINKYAVAYYENAAV
jgi:hypothetical protein